MASFCGYYVGEHCTKVIEELVRVYQERENGQITETESNDRLLSISASFHQKGTKLDGKIFNALKDIANETEEGIYLSSAIFQWYRLSVDELDDILRDFGICGFQMDENIKPQQLVEMYEHGWKMEGFYPNGRDFRGVVFTR